MVNAWHNKKRAIIGTTTEIDKAFGFADRVNVQCLMRHITVLHWQWLCHLAVDDLFS